MDQPIFRRSLETQSLVKLLSDDKHSETFTYEELSAAANCDVQSHRGPLQSAIRIVQREKGFVYEAIAKVGVKRCGDVEIVDSGARDISRIRNAARRSMKRAACVRDFAALPQAKQKQHNLQMSSAALLYHVTTTSAQNKIESKVERATAQLPVAETIAALTNGKE